MLTSKNEKKSRFYLDALFYWGRRVTLYVRSPVVYAPRVFPNSPLFPLLLQTKPHPLAPRSNPHPAFMCIMQSVVTTVLFSWDLCRKKSKTLLLSCIWGSGSPLS